jgi:hypothetical protein
VALTFKSVAAAQRQTACEFSRELAGRFHFVVLPSGRVCRTLGPPAGCEPTSRANVWRQAAAMVPAI